uniref:H(+)-exporting diphosphatase n=1 Tax=Solanum tuberosum TaxID=4113 RepID=M1BI22_SOLTU
MFSVDYNLSPVQEAADSCKTGAATNLSYVWHCKLNAALGMLSTIATGLAIDAYGPINDNAGGIAEMAGMSHSIREKIDALDAAGNTTAAIGKILKIEVTSQDASLEDAKDYYYFAMEVMQNLIS